MTLAVSLFNGFADVDASVVDSFGDGLDAWTLDNSFSQFGDILELYGSSL